MRHVTARGRPPPGGGWIDRKTVPRPHTVHMHLPGRRVATSVFVHLSWPCLVLTLACTPATSGEGDSGGGVGATGGKAATDGGGGAGTRTGGSSGGGSAGAPSGSTGGTTATGGAGGAGGVGAAGTGGVISVDGGASGNSGGAGGSGEDAAAGAGGSGDAGTAGAAGTDGGPAAHMECPQPSIDRLTWWKATGEGATIPKNEGATLLVKEGDHYVAKEEFVGSGWHVFEIVTGPSFESKADLSKSKGFWLTYNTTGELYMQMRPASKYDGGAQWATKIPTTNGQSKQVFFSFDPKNWAGVAELGQPTLPFASTLNQVRGLLLVGKTPNLITISQLRIENYEPACP
jgi:hypothetical protein